MVEYVPISPNVPVSIVLIESVSTSTPSHFVSGRDAEARSEAFRVSKNIIEAKYGMNHIYLAPPKIMSVSLDFRTWMEMKMTSYPPGGYLPGLQQNQKLLFKL